MIRILVVDDSAFMRKILGDLIGEMDGMKVIGTARDGLEALDRAKSLEPDVITLDVEMPRMDGLTALTRIVGQYRLPVILVSSLTTRGARTTLQGLSLGAVDFMAKPSRLFGNHWASFKAELERKIRWAHRARGRVRLSNPVIKGPGEPQARGGSPLTAVMGPSNTAEAQQLIAVGSSTGGPPALEALFSRLRLGAHAAVVVTQHMPAGFTRSLAERLDRLVRWNVHEAQDGERIIAGTIYIAAGDFHLRVRRNLTLGLDSGPPVHHVRPAVDIMFASVAENFRGPTCAAVLTGMGRDGAEGLSYLRRKGAYTLAQSEESCVIFGMPNAALELDAVVDVAPIEGLANHMNDWLDVHSIDSTSEGGRRG